MSWWDPKSFSGLASQALKTAQKQIDKVLDIEEREKEQRSLAKTGKPLPVSSPEDEASKDVSNSWNSWSSWMAPKAADSEEKTETETKDAQPAASSSWSFSWGSQQNTDLTPSTTWSHTPAARNQTSVAKKSASKISSYSLSGSDGKKNNVSLSEETSAWVSKKESLKDDDESKVEKYSERLQPDVDEIQQRQGESEKDVVPAAEEETAARSESPGKDDSSAAQAAAFSQDTVAEKTGEEINEIQTSVLLSNDKDEASLDSDSEPHEQCGLKEADSAEDAQAAYIEEEQQISLEGTEQFFPETSESGTLLIASEFQQDKANSLKSVETVEDAINETCEPSASATSSLYETFETIPEDVGKEETVENFDMTASEASSETVRDQSPDSPLSRDSSFAQISFSDNAQAESVTSVSSEPILLSVSTEGKDSSNLLDVESTDADLFSPPSHSSLAVEEVKEEGSPTERALSPVGSPPPESTATVSSNESSETSRLDSSADTLVDRCQQLLEDSDSGKWGTEDDGQQQWLEDSNLAGLEASSSPSASFVKCMIEEAMGMEDASKHDDSGSDNHSEEKSESSKVDSEFEKSVYSGHESSDDIETTTSSDIEIISTPTPNGEKNIVDLSPLKFSLQKAARGQGPGHQRTDSQSSSSTNSKGEGDHLSPERDCDHERGPTPDWHREGKGLGQQQHSVVHQEDLDNPQHPQRLLKSCKNRQEKDVVKKLAETAEVLQARERQLMQLSKDNNDLLETNSILRSQLQQAEEAREAEMTDLKALTEEFTRRMGEAERKMQTVLKEKEAVKEQLQLAQRELTSRSSDVNLEAVLAEKDEQITGLLEEGEKLSKQQLQNSNIIKKLRSKEKENEKQLTSQKKKLDQQKEELDQLKAVLDSKEDMEKKQSDAIKQLNTAVQLIEKEKAKLKTEVESSEERIRGLQSTLDNSYKEIAELHKNNASQDSRAQQAALSTEMQVREELKMAMEQESQHHRHEKEALLIQIEDLRLSLARMEKEHNRREEMLKQEITDLQMRLQEDESRNQDLTQSVTSATRPLLRQIENLQATHSMQAAAWEKVERNLTERLTEAQTLLALAQEKERAAAEKLTEISGRCAALESSNGLLRQEKAQLAAQQDSDRRRIEMLEERKAHDVAQLELAKQKLSEEVAAIRRDKVFLESQLETERSRLESERQRVAVAEEQIRILERERPKSRGTPSPVSVSRQESMNSSLSERSATPTWLPRPEEGEGHFVTSQGIKVSLYDSMRQSGAASLMENLHSQLKLREGEITQLQADIQQLERTRESMARELVNLTNLNEELQEEVQELPKVRTQFKELDARYNALLQMYGEKEERVQELMLDLEDVKEMYKQQINSLMK